VNPILNFRLTWNITGEASYFPYVPLNRAGHFQQVLERVKLERPVTRWLKAGAGYGAYESGSAPVQNKPFVTATFSTKAAGSLELWLQRMPDGAQVQMRYAFAHTAKPRR
jgi:hypothetical protein